MPIKQRLVKINQIANAPTTSQNDPLYRNGSRRTYNVQSTRNNAPYQVFIEWSKDIYWTVKTQLYTYNHKEWANKRGNHIVDFCHTTVCYQALGVLKWAARQAGKILSICETKQAAERLLNFGGQLVKITNLGNGVVWGTVR